jgi:hypothetical protein
VGFMNDEKDLDNKKKLDTEAGQALAQMSDESYLEDVQGVKLCIAVICGVQASWPRLSR